MQCHLYGHYLISPRNYIICCVSTKIGTYPQRLSLTKKIYISLLIASFNQNLLYLLCQCLCLHTFKGNSKLWHPNALIEVCITCIEYIINVCITFYVIYEILCFNFEAANILIGFFRRAMLIFIGKFDGRRNELISEKNLVGERDCTSWGPSIFWSKIAKANVDENERVMMNVRSPEFKSSGVVLQSRYQQTSGEKLRWGTFGSIFKSFKSIEYVLL